MSRFVSWGTRQFYTHGGASPTPADQVIMWLFKQKQMYYQRLLNEIEAMLVRNGITPIRLFGEPRVLHYLTFYPFNHIYNLLVYADADRTIGPKAREFATFIRKLYLIKKKRINLLLDSPTDYEYEYPLSIGWKDNPRYEQELENYQVKVKEYEQIRAALADEREKLWENAEARVYSYVQREYGRIRCPVCTGTGVIPKIDKRPLLCCYSCKGSGKRAYLPRVTSVQKKVAEAFKRKLESLKEPEFTSFPRRRKSVYIRVIYGGQIFLNER